MVKTYAKHYVTKYDYRYTDEDGNEACDTLVFTANAGLFPLFKSYTQKELGDAVKEYKEALLKLTSGEGYKVMQEYLNAPTEEAKLAVINEYPEEMIQYINASYKAGMLENGRSLFVTLPICMYAASHTPEEGREILALGYEALPSELYENMEFCLELLKLVFDFDDDCKKKQLYTAKGARQSR